MIDVVGCELMRGSDLATIEAGVSGIELIWRAANGIFNSVSWHGSTAIICGGGNNAADGYALALILQENSIDCTLILTCDKFTPDGEYYYKKCRDVSVKTVFYDDFTTLDGYDIIVDCIFGTGFHGTPSKRICEVIEKINQSGAYIVSADINSALNGDTGLCEAAVKSDLTVAIGSYKPGHFLSMAKDFIKSLTCVDIGIEIIGNPYHLIEAQDVKKAFKERSQMSNKGTYGYATLIGGCTEYSGAIKLANLSLCALKSGVGVSKLATARSICHSVMPYLLESTLYPLDDENGHIIFSSEQIDGALKGVRAVAIGMGIGSGDEVYKIISHILGSYEMPVIIDADGLNALARGGLDILKKTKCTVILTPHPKELERLCGVSVSEILDSPIEIARKFAFDYGVVLLLKGATTIVTDGNEVYFVDRGCGGMATAGSGDVLSGILLGICAQSPAPSAQTSNTCAAAYVNGLAGELAQASVGAISMTSSDTVSQIPRAIKSVTEDI